MKPLYNYFPSRSRGWESPEIWWFNQSQYLCPDTILLLCCDMLVKTLRYFLPPFFLPVKTCNGDIFSALTYLTSKHIAPSFGLIKKISWFQSSSSNNNNNKTLFVQHFSKVTKCLTEWLRNETVTNSVQRAEKTNGSNTIMTLKQSYKVHHRTPPKRNRKCTPITKQINETRK